jgi:hypothetical protein
MNASKFALSKAKFCALVVAHLLRKNFKISYPLAPGGHMQFRKMIAAIFMLAVSLAGLSPALAQQTPNKGTAIEETQLRSFAKAYAEVQKIREFYEPQLGTAQDAQKSSEIEREARSKITEAIGKEGLTLDSYSQIVQTANADEALRKRIIELINEEKKNSQSTP